MDNIERYRRDLSRFKYSPEARQDLIMRAYDGDAEARKQLIESLLWLPYTLAQKFWRNGTAADLEDLIQAGNIALLGAVASWQPTGGAKLTTWIRWACERDMRRESALTNVVSNSTYEVSYDTDEVQDDEVDTLARVWEADERVLSFVAALEPDLSDVITQLYVQGKSLREVADNMKKSHTHVARLRDTGLLALREAMRV